MQRIEVLSIHSALLHHYLPRVQSMSIPQTRDKYINTFWFGWPKAMTPGIGLVLYQGEPNMINNCPTVVYMVE